MGAAICGASSCGWPLEICELQSTAFLPTKVQAKALWEFSSQSKQEPWHAVPFPGVYQQEKVC